MSTFTFQYHTDNVDHLEAIARIAEIVNNAGRLDEDFEWHDAHLRALNYVLSLVAESEYFFSEVSPNSWELFARLTRELNQQD